MRESSSIFELLLLLALRKDNYVYIFHSLFLSNSRSAPYPAFRNTNFINKAFCFKVN